MAFYDEMQQMARDLLRPDTAGGLGQGEISLTSVRPGVVDPLEPWEPVEPVKDTKTLKGAVRGISSELVGKERNDTVLQLSDRVAICEVPSIEYQAGDVLTVDGEAVHIISYEKIPAAGTTAAVRFIIRG